MELTVAKGGVQDLGVEPELALGRTVGDQSPRTSGR